jgi:Arc/MetJ family transcription regulator
MRTTLDIDDSLMVRAQAMFPPGTSKTALVEEGLRRLLGSGQSAAVPNRPRRDPRMQRLIDEGRVTPASNRVPIDPPPIGAGGNPLAELLQDLERDREDR